MAGPIFADRVQESSTTTGTGTYTLGGATTGFQAWSVVGNGNTAYYMATDNVNWEVGLGTYTLSGTTLARTAILSSSNANAAVNWTAGTRTVSLVDPAAALVNFTWPVATRTAMAGLSTSQMTSVYLLEAGRQGQFQWNSGNLSTQVTGDTQQGIYVPPSSDTTGASGAWVRVYVGAVAVEWFGAVGDGSTNDATAINAAISVGIVALLANKVYAISSTINLTSDSKVLMGLGRSGGVFNSSSQLGAVLKWTGSSGGRMVQAGSLTGGVDMHGGGLLNVQLDGNSLANVGLQVQTIDSAQFENIKILNLHDNSGAIALFLTSGTASFAPVNCVYRCSFRNIEIQVPGATNGIYNNTAATSGGGQNTTFCVFENIHIEYLNGLGCYISAMDDCTFNNIATSRNNTGTGANFYLDGNAVSGKGVFAVVFNLVQPGVTSGTPTIVSDGAFSRQNMMTVSGVDGAVTPSITNGAELFYYYLGSGTSGSLTTEAPLQRTPPIQFATGLTGSPTAGVMDYDGKAFYGTAVASSRQVIDAEQVTILSADNTTPTNVNTAQNVFPTGQGTLAVQGSTTYEFEASYEIDTTGATSNSLSVDFSGTWAGSITYDALATNGTTSSTSSAPLMTRSTTAASQTITAAVAAATQRTIKLRGTMVVTTAGSFTPQFKYSAAPGAAPVVRTGSFFRCWPVGSNTVTSVGNWS